MESGLHIELAAERLGNLWGIPVTNTLITTWIVMGILIIAAFFIGRNPKLIPGKVQSVFEWLFEYVLKFMEETLGSRGLAIRYFPLIATIFIFIFASNLFDFLPIFNSIGLYRGDELIPLFRPINTDLNMPLALAIISVIAIEIIGITTVGFFRYAGKFINFSSPVNFIVGLIELVSELSRFISFSFRLFGNIFAGEVLLAVIGLFVPYGLPVPLMGFELFVGFIQATVFAMLTLFFIKLAITKPHGSESH